jgi:6-phosphogluconolactonase
LLGGFVNTDGRRLGTRVVRWVGALVLAIAVVISVRAGVGAKTVVYIGTYTEHGSKGIYVCSFDAGTGRLGSPVLAAETSQASFLAASSDRKFLYAVNEVDHFDGKATGAVSAFSIDSSSGKLTLLNQVSSGDPGPAHIVLDRTGKYVLVANYDGGSVAVFHLLPDGKIGEAAGFARHSGSSVNRERQEGPHAHAVAMSPDNRFALVADLGLDELFLYPFDDSSGTLGEARVMKTDAGAGPRHLVFSGDGKFVYVINELTSIVVVYSYEASRGAMNPVQTVSTLRSGFAGANTAAEVALHPSDTFLYASNRGDDNSIAVFAVDPAKGTLTLIEHVPTNGKTPRHFAIDPGGRWLIAANQDSNSIVTFRIDGKTGRLTAVGQPTEVFSPTMVDFVTLGSGK